MGPRRIRDAADRSAHNAIADREDNKAACHETGGHQFQRDFSIQQIESLDQYRGDGVVATSLEEKSYLWQPYAFEISRNDPGQSRKGRRINQDLYVLIFSLAGIPATGRWDGRKTRPIGIKEKEMNATGIWIFLHIVGSYNSFSVQWRFAW